MTIAHISDLHFSYTTPALQSALIYALREAKPHLTVISGDLTQRARHAQFAEAQRFIEALPHPLLVVPGNHDVPLYDLFRRFFNPTDLFRRYICDDLLPVYQSPEILAVGVNSTRAFTLDPFGFWKNGSVSHRQLTQLAEKFAQATPGQLKLLVVHHPLVNPWNDGSRDTIRGRARMFKAIEAMGIDLVLSGHLHKAYARSIPARLPCSRPLLCVQAGTACSTRLRDEANAFNLITKESDGQLKVMVMRYDGNQFVVERPDSSLLQSAH